MTDLTERLHAIASQQAGTFSDANVAVLHEAAAKIERLRTALREAHRVAVRDHCWDVVALLDKVLSGKGET